LRICTIIARNYLGKAEVLAESFREHHPGGSVSVLVLDDVEKLVPSRPELFETVRPQELSMPRFEAMAAMYDISELSTAVKPWLLRHLLDAGEPVAYLDPDVCFYGEVGHLLDLARERQIVLAPHTTQPLPDDGRRPNNADLLEAGAYDLGFIALGPGQASDELLDWWITRVHVDDPFGPLVDGRWFDLVPAMFPDTAIVRDPALNVGYWNLHERELGVDSDGRYLVGEAPLRSFHFSGFDPHKPHELGRHQNRYRLSEVPALANLCAEYAERVLACSPGFGEPDGAFTRLADGRVLDRAHRTLYREGERQRAFQLSPFTVEGTNEFIKWLAAVAPDAPAEGVNRYWTQIYRSRPDLQRAFPDLAGADRESYLRWILTHGVAEVESRGLLPAQPEPDAGAQPQTEPGAQPRTALSAASPAPVVSADADVGLWGVNVGGFMESEIGVGEAARATISALDAVRVPVLPIHGSWRPPSRQGHRYAMFAPQDAVYPVNLLCVTADLTEQWLAEAGPDFRAGRYTIGQWWWEVTTWPEQWLGAFDHVDEVWVATEHIHAALSPVATVPVTKITLPIQAPTPHLRSRAELGLPDGFLFFFMFDYRSIVERKNPFDLIQAFVRAFAPDEGAKLAIKCVNQDANPLAHGRLRRAAAEHPDVHLIEGFVSAADKNSMLASADCYVSLHRAEGYGLTLAESLLLEKPVIATGYSGNLDFMSPSGSWLVDSAMVPIGPGNDPYPAHGEWAQPDIEQASRYMREVFEDPAAARKRAARGAAAIRRTHSLQAAGATMAARLEQLRSHRSQWPTRELKLPEEPGPQLDAASALLARGPAPTRERSGRLRSALRRSALRAMKPYTAFERQVDHTLLDAIRALDERIDRIAAEQACGSRGGTQAGVVAAAVRALEFSMNELSAQLSAASHERAESERELEQRVATLQAGIAAQLTELSSRIAALERPGLVSDRARFASLAALHRAHAEVDGGPGVVARADSLEGYELRGFSQNGEDGVLAEILARIGTENRFFVEFGIESGREGNCVYLAQAAGWRGLFIEADPDVYCELSQRYAANGRIQTVEALVTPENIEQLFADARVPEDLDVLSIDVDGGDYWLWEALAAYRPRTLVIEYNSALPPDVRLAQPREYGGWDGTDYQGASLGAMVWLGEQKGYRLVHTETSGVNAFFVREELARGRFPAPETIPRREPNYFQIGYRHPPHTNGRRYLDLETGQLVAAPQNGRQGGVRGQSGFVGTP
jgi:glycosyltransferase involved in cell wall biosynthesis